MPRPKPTFDSFKHLFEGMDIVVSKDCDFNTNTKIVVKCPNKHEYVTSITKIKSLGHDYKKCPHCKKKEKYKSLGIPFSVIDDYAKKNNLIISPVKDFYNRWEDTITFTCKHDSYTFEVKSLFYWEENTRMEKFTCPQCEKKSLGIIISNDEFLNSLKSNLQSDSSPLLLPKYDYSILTDALRYKIENQSKWNLVHFANTKEKCKYQCTECGNIKETNPFNIFTGGGFGCQKCNHNKTLEKRRNRIFDICKDNEIQVTSKNDNDYTFKCNKCGNSFDKTCIISDYKNYSISCPECYKNNKRKAQKEVEVFVNNLGFSTICEYKDIGCEVDIFVPDKKVAIEYCGLVWHSTKYRKDTKCHKKKLDLCNKNGIRLITMYEDEWRNKRNICESRIKSILGVIKNRIFARKCEVVVIDNKEALRFCDENHIQGRGQAHISIGMKHNDKLISVMTFSKPSISKSGKEYDWEINRFCSLVDMSVIGGANRMLSLFRKDHSNCVVVTFCDMRWGNGGVYENMGFTEEKQTLPGYYYFGKLTKYKRLHRFSFTKRKLLSILGIESSPLTEEEISDSLGLYRIYDCGHKRYKLNI